MRIILPRCMANWSSNYGLLISFSLEISWCIVLKKMMGLHKKRFNYCQYISSIKEKIYGCINIQRYTNTGVCSRGRCSLNFPDVGVSMAHLKSLRLFLLREESPLQASKHELGPPFGHGHVP